MYNSGKYKYSGPVSVGSHQKISLRKQVKVTLLKNLNIKNTGHCCIFIINEQVSLIDDSSFKSNAGKTYMNILEK